MDIKNGQFWIKSLLPLFEEDRESDWRVYPVFRGSTPSLGTLECHVSVLSRDKIPHPPHSHSDEELIIILSGEVDIISDEEIDKHKPKRRRLGPNSFVYHASCGRHTIQNKGLDSSIYLVFKWRDDPLKENHHILSTSVAAQPAETELSQAGIPEDFNVVSLLNSPTLYLHKLRAHFSTLKPGTGYTPHRDGYDTAIVLLGGSVETLGRSVDSPSVIFYGNNVSHGMKNSRPTTAEYLAFEFHRQAP